MSLKIEDIMVIDVKTADITSTITDIVKEMYNNEIGSVIITKDNRPIGIITERDIVQKIVVPGKNANELQAQDIMSTPLKTGSKDMSLLDAIRILVLNRIKKLPIMDDNDNLIGIISLFDLVRWTPL
ncbi:MAG: CBS domain-containing protein, partial [Candidatus Helarchaeota archaeon]